MNVVYALSLHEGNEKKFSLETISKAVSAITIIWNEPLRETSSHRSVQIIYKTVGSMEQLFENDGDVVQVLGNRNGKRRVVTGGWGRCRKRYNVHFIK